MYGFVYAIATSLDPLLGIELDLHLHSRTLLEYSAFTHREYYPYSLNHENQDSFWIKTKIQGNPILHFFGVFDEHGRYGDKCSHFVRDILIEILSSDPALLDDLVKAYNSAFLVTNSDLHDSEMNDIISGTTAITILVIGDTLFVANVRGSRAELGDFGAETIGVIGVPEVSVVKLMPHHMFFVIASDGVFQYFMSQVVFNMVAKYRDPRDACAAVAGETYKKCMAGKIWANR
ncbi:hypothetical protein Sjap_011174 [Stephania japonica]|uniref:PPM-type phosphatase domain-containing protein n=1 Tax=Stephania japonica TaxID=461633 RepID=A0AAP0P4H0_9MAGN